MRKRHQRILTLILVSLGILWNIKHVESLVSSNSLADLVLINGKVITVDSRDSIAEAVAADR